MKTHQRAIQSRFFQAMALVGIFALCLINYYQQNIDNLTKSQSLSLSSKSNFFKDKMPSCSQTGRCDAMDISQKFTYVHISKCAGTSLISTLKQHITQFFPRQEAGEEWSIPESKRRYANTKYLLIAFKSPRRHLWSLFAQCKYSQWGQNLARHTTFPNDDGGHSDHPNNRTDVVDFSVWLDHFLLDGRPSMARQDNYGCYHASNLQSRAVTTTGCCFQWVETGEWLVPRWERAETMYWKELQWVALTEFYHESMCLLTYRISRGGGDGVDDGIDATTSPWAVDYVEKYCRCVGSRHPSELKVTVMTHRKEGHRETFTDLDADVLRRIEALTEVDMRLYEMSLYQFFNEIIWLETSLGRRVMCDAALEAQEVELAYLLREAPTNNVTSLYYAMKEYNEVNMVY